MSDNFRHAQYDARGVQIDNPQDLRALDRYLVSKDAFGSVANTEGYVTRLIKTIANRELTRGCLAIPKFLLYIDPVNGNDLWDGSVGVFTSGTTGPKRTAVAANWVSAGSTKTSVFSGEILLFRGGTEYTHTEANGRITIASRRHIGAYYTAQNQARPIINGTIYASGDVSDISIQGVEIRPTTANQPCIHLQQTAAGQACRRITIRGNTLAGGSINNATAIGAVHIAYYNNYGTQDEYMHCHEILVTGNHVRGFPGHGLFFGGAIGMPIGQTNGIARFTAAGNLANTETVSICGITFTAVTTIGATAGNFLIGANKQATLQNLAALINAPATTNANQVALSAGSQAVLASIGARATVRGNVLTLELTSFYAAAYLSETAAAASWDRSYTRTEQIWGGIDVINNIVEDCGAGMDCHALSSYSAGVLLSRTSLTWTNLSGSVWYTDVSAAAVYNYQVPSIDIVQYDTGNGTELFKLVPAYCEPANLNPGEFLFDPSNQRLYCNGNITFNTSIRLSICTRSAKGIRWINNTLRRQKFNNILGGTAHEGHGVAFDDFTSYCASFNNDIQEMAGVPVTINRGDFCLVVGNYGHDFVLGCVKVNFGWGHVISKSCFVFYQVRTTDRGYSDTVPGFRGYLHIANASTRLGGVTAPTTPANNDETPWFSTIVNQVDLIWNGTATDVAALLGPTSGNAPPLIATDVNISGTGSIVPQAGRVVFATLQQALNDSSLPINVDALR